MPRDHSTEPQCPECAAMVAGLRLDDEHRSAVELFGGGRDEEEDR